MTGKLYMTVKHPSKACNSQLFGCRF